MGTLSLILDLIQFFCWSMVYLTAIVKGLRRKTWLIPAFSICFNITWEFWSIVLRWSGGQGMAYGTWISTLWLLLDIGVATTLLLYWPRKYGPGVVGYLPMAGLALGFAAGSLLIRWPAWLPLAAFIDNTLMSALFLRPAFLREGGGRWSAPIGWMKLFGTLCATVVEGVLNRRGTLLYLGGICLFLDVCYLVYGKESMRKCHE